MLEFGVKVTDEKEWELLDEWCKQSLRRWRGDISKLTGNGHHGYFEFTPKTRSYRIANKDAPLFILRWK